MSDVKEAVVFRSDADVCPVDAYDAIEDAPVGADHDAMYRCSNGHTWRYFETVTGPESGAGHVTLTDR